MKSALHDKIVTILDRCPDMTIATVRPDGAPQATVVSFVHDGLQIYFGTGREAQKAVNIEREPRVSVTVTAPYADWQHIEGVSLAGIAGEVTSAQEKALVGKLMLDRFPQLMDSLEQFQNETKLFRVRPTLVSVLDYSKGFGHTDLVAIDTDEAVEMKGGDRQQRARG